ARGDLDLTDVDLAVGGGDVAQVPGTAGLLGAGVVDRVDAGRPGAERRLVLGEPAGGPGFVEVQHLHPLAGLTVAVTDHTVRADLGRGGGDTGAGREGRGAVGP